LLKIEEDYSSFSLTESVLGSLVTLSIVKSSSNVDPVSVSVYSPLFFLLSNSVLLCSSLIIAVIIIESAKAVNKIDKEI
jgi:hypothetical protein